MKRKERNHERETKHEVMDGRPGEHEPNKKGGDTSEKERGFEVMDVRNSNGGDIHRHELALDPGASSGSR